MSDPKEANNGRSTLKELCEEVEAIAMKLTATLFDLGRMSAEAIAHDVSDDSLHPVVIGALRDMDRVIQSMSTQTQHTGILNGLAELETIRQNGYTAAIDAATIDYAMRDGAKIQAAVLPMIAATMAHTKGLRALRHRLEAASVRHHHKQRAAA